MKRRHLLYLCLFGVSLVPSAAEAGRDDCGLEDPDIARAAPVVPRKAGEVSGIAGSTPVVRRVRAGASARGAWGFGTVGNGAAGGALAGKTIYVSAGHGWTWRDGSSAWRTQRGNTNDLVEDFISAETVAQYLVRLLRNMGAYVVPIRESDLNSNLAVVDDASAGGAMATEGDVVLTDGPTGFGVLPTPITDQSNPFDAGASKELAAQAQETGRVVWTFDVPEDGAYNVYITYVQDPSRASDAHYVVRHAGGQSEFRVDQRRHGSTWVLLGRFWFERGISPMYGAISLADDSADTNATLSADAVRIGGGVGVIDRGGGANGRPMFESCARYAAQLKGAPPSVYDYSSGDGNDDVGTRSRFAAWDHEAGEDAVYIAWHTNAPDPGTGTSSFTYGPSSYGPVSEFSGVPGSLELMDAVHSELVGDIRAAWDTGWRDRGQHTAYFGEVNPNHNSEMPAALFEIAFHDTPSDADALRDPGFRYIAARSIAQGVAKYFATRDGLNVVLAPEQPTAVRAEQDGDGLVLVSWRPPAADPAGGDPPSAYRVYTSLDGNAFDDGVDVNAPSIVVAAPEGAALYVRVTATNAGGESFPTRVVGARPSPGGQPQVLVVGGFNRLDNKMLIPEDLSDYALATIERGLLARINDGSHLLRYGAAIDAAQVSFASASAASVSQGDVDLSGYTAVIWQLGEESTAAGPLDAAQRTALTDYLAGGGRLAMTGSELGWALDNRGDPDEQMFFRETLHATYVADDADTYAVVGATGAFEGMSQISFDDFGPGSYNADYPDVLDPSAGGASVLSYAGGAGGSAATWWRDSASGAQVLVLGFPFETISGEAARADVMARILASFEIDADPLIIPPLKPPMDPPGDDDGLFGACGCQTDGGGSGGALLLLGTLLLLRRRRRR